MKILLIWLLLVTPVWAAEVVICDPTNPQVPNAVTRHQASVDVVFEASEGRTFSLVWQAPNVSMTPAQVTAANTLRAQLDSLKGIPSRYWLCTDANTDGTVDGLREMTPTEKTTLDAPDVAAKAESDAARAELTTLESGLDADDTAWTSLTTAQKLAVMKKVLRAQVLRRKLGQ